MCLDTCTKWALSLCSCTLSLSGVRSFLFLFFLIVVILVLDLCPIVYPQCTQFGIIINNIFTLSIEKKKKLCNSESQTINLEKKRKKEKKKRHLQYNFVYSLLSDS